MINLRTFESFEFINEAKKPVYHDVMRKDKEEVDEKDLGGYLTGKLEELEKEEDPKKKKVIMLIIENPKFWQREFVLAGVDKDKVKVLNREGKEVVFKIKEVLEIYTV